MNKQALAIILGGAIAIVSFGANEIAFATEEIPSDNSLHQTTDGTQFRQIKYSYKKTGYVLQMAFDAKAQAALKSDPIADVEKGQILIDALEQRGGVLQDVKRPDGSLVPSEQQFSERTGKTTAIIYRRAGQQQDPAPGIAAVQGWDAITGAPSYTFYFSANQLQNPSPSVPAPTKIQNSVTVYEYYQAGKLEDPQPGQPARKCVNSDGKLLWEGHYRNNALQDMGDQPAWQEFDPATGRATVQDHCQNELYEDPLTGEPAQQTYDGKSGALISASHCSHGKVIHQLDAGELAAFAAREHVSLKAAN